MDLRYRYASVLVINITIHDSAQQGCHFGSHFAELLLPINRNWL